LKTRYLIAFQLALSATAFAAPIINEIRYRPGSTFPENPALEFIEIYNPDTAAVDMSGWALTSGADFTFPAGTSIAAGGYLVVAANPTTLGVAGALGPWAAGATLSNNGEDIALSKPGSTAGTFTTVDVVDYADEGDWAVRIRESGTGGWIWSTGANGGGKSLEKRNPTLAVSSGQNWGESVAVGGSPGAANALLTANVAPIISKVKHSPAVPTSSDAVKISCKLADEAAITGSSATLFWRNASTSTPAAFSSVAMSGNGSGSFSVTLAALGDKQIVEFYVSATDGTLTRTWPAPTIEGQNANCAYQVDNGTITGSVPAYRLVLTAAENAAFESLAATTPTSNRQFNATLIAQHGTQTTIRYRTSMRIRGQSSRNYTIKPLRISMPTDDRWDGVSDFNINPKYPWLQFLGMRSLLTAGLPASYATPIEARRNGVEYTTGSTSAQDYGMMARVEDLNGDYTSNHWPTTDDIQVYRKPTSSYWSSTGTAPTTPDGSYSGWTKQSLTALNDWSDLVAFTQLWQNTAASHFTGASTGNVQSGTWDGTAFSDAEVAALSTVADFDQWARWFAVMTIIGNNEPNISTGGDDDYSAAFVPDGLGNRRLEFLPHDLDTHMGQGDSVAGATSVGLYGMTETGSVFEPLLPLFGTSTAAGNAAFRVKYLTAIRELYGTVFDSDTTGNPTPSFHVFIDNHLAAWAPEATRTAMKTWMTQRQAYLLGLIGAPKIVPGAATSDATLTSTPGTLRINEVLAVQAATHLNSTTYPDVIELYNSGAVAISLAGKSLSDDPANPTKYVFPTGTNLAPGGYLLVFADSQTTAPGLHTSFGLDTDGDQIRLYESVANGGALLDAVAFGPQLSDLSIARTGVAQDTWALSTPTLGAANGAALTLGSVAGVKINEWAGNIDFRLNDDFIELYNPAAQPVALGGLRLTDHYIAYPTRYSFPTLSFIAAGGFTVRDGDDLGFSVDGAFEHVFLLGANGALMDRVDLVSQFSDVSAGRSPDGSHTWANFSLPTPNLSNTFTSANHTALVASLRITEIMYAPTGGNNYEFIELQNIGTTTLDLGGVRFTSGIDYTFATGTMLPPGAFAVVCRSRSHFLARYPSASGTLAAGSFSGSLDNSGETIALTLPFPLGVNLHSFRYEASWQPLTATSGYSLSTLSQTITPPGDWDESTTWIASLATLGTPGSDDPPVILSASSAAGIAGDPFSYQITASKVPTSYAASGLPAGLSVNASTGLISGTPVSSGTSTLTLSASNTGGTGTANLLLTIAAFGPVNSFVWDYVPATANASAPFAVKVSARDAGGRLVPTFSGATTLTASTGGTGASSPIVITEATDEFEDQFELQNVGAATVNTTGWFVIIGDSTTNISGRNAITFALPTSMASGALLRVSETNTAGRTWFGGPIGWTNTTPRGWIMLFDSTTTLRDFFAFGWNSAQIPTLALTVNAQPITVGSHWSGNGVVAGTRGNINTTTDSWRRIGTGEVNASADWAWSQNAQSFGTTNAGLTLPWAIATSFTIAPLSLTYASGQHLGYLTGSSAAPTVRLTAADGAGHNGQSTAFDILAALADTDSDGLPDAWENANGLTVGVNDATLDDDGDGASNANEYRAGTHPRQSNSRLYVGGISFTNPAQLNVTWDAVAGKLYRAATSTNLQTWSALPGSARLPTASGSQSLSLDPASSNPLFIRIEIVPQ
jgi:Lamin Tail Domain/Putative Ig domain/CotH kinase protein